jgi:hypothetical protein
VYADDSGPEMRRMLLALSVSAKWPLDPIVECSAIVPDDKGKSGMPHHIRSPLHDSLSVNYQKLHV